MTTRTSEPSLLVRNRPGNWGLKFATWQQIADAIEILGGHFVRSGGNSHQIYRLNDTTFTLPKPSKMEQTTGRGTLARYIKRVEGAGIEPALFVAVLGGLGAGWQQQPADLRELQRLVRLNTTLLNREKGRQAILQAAEENLRRKSIERHEREVNVAEATNQYTHGLTDAIRLGLGDKPDPRILNRFQKQFSAQLAGENPTELGEKLLRSQQITKVEGSGRGRWMLNEDGAMAVADYVETVARERGWLTTAEEAEPAPRPAPEPKRPKAKRDEPPQPQLIEGEPTVRLNLMAIAAAVTDYLIRAGMSPGRDLMWEGINPNGEVYVTVAIHQPHEKKEEE